MSSIPRVAFPGFEALLACGHSTPLPAPISHKLIRVLRMQPGQSFVVFDPKNAMEAAATLCAIEPATANIAVATQGVKATRDIRLLQGLSKGDKNECILQDATELGASCVHFAEMQRSVVRISNDKRDARRARWTAIAESAASQCGRSDVPRLMGPSTLRDAMSEHQGARVLVLYEGGGAPFGEVLRGALLSPLPILLVVGPEGGLAAEDMAILDRVGCTYCTLGPYILRTETVAAAALGTALVLGQDLALAPEMLIR